MEPPDKLELRIHGVSNTPPARMLGVKDASYIDQRIGDTSTGFFRRKENPPGAPMAEAYSWGSLNSRADGAVAAVTRALWLLLLPFALINVGYWARPKLTPPTVDARANRGYIGAVLMRIAGLLLTAYTTATAAYVGIDLIGWQCFRGGDPRCPTLPSSLGFLADSPWDEPARRIAIGALVPLGWLIILWLLSRNSLQRYEEQPDPSQQAGAWPRKHLLERRYFWSGAERLLRLQRLHLAFGVATVVVLTAFPVAKLRDLSAGHGGSPLPLWILAGLAGLLMVAVLVATARSTLESPEFHSNGAAEPVASPAALPGWLLVAGLLLLAADLYWLLVPYYRIVEFGENANLPGSGAWPLMPIMAMSVLVAFTMHLNKLWALLVVVVAVACGFVYAVAPSRRSTGIPILLGALFVVGVLSHVFGKRGGDSDRHAWRGAAGGVLLGAAVAVVLLYSTAFALGAANYLNGDAAVSDIVATTSTTGCPEPPVEALATCTPPQRPDDREHAVNAVVNTTGPATVKHGWVQVAGETVTVHSGELRTDQVFRVFAGNQDASREPTVSLASGDVTLAQDVLVLDHTNVSATEKLADAHLVDTGQVTVPGKKLVVAVPAPKEGEHDAPVHVIARDVGSAAVLSVPLMYIWVATLMPLFTLANVVALLFCVARLSRKLRPGITTRWQADVAGGPPQTTVGGRMLGARRAAALAHRAETLIGVVGVIVTAATLTGIGGALTGEQPWDAWTWIPRWMGDAGLYLAVITAALILVLGALLQRSATVRRTVGVLWDLTALWPRVAHPFGPPCYAERAVPDLYVRSRWVLGQPQGRVVFSGHSLGSVLAVATILRYPPTDRGRLGLVSYGSQLRAFFGRLFPDVLGPDVLGNAASGRIKLASGTVDELAPPAANQTYAPSTATDSLAATLRNPSGQLRWIGLFRRTDPLGYRVWSDDTLVAENPGGANDVDRYVGEVVDPPAGDPTPAKIDTHGDYPLTAAYEQAVLDTFSRMP